MCVGGGTGGGDVEGDGRVNRGQEKCRMRDSGGCKRAEGGREINYPGREQREKMSRFEGDFVPLPRSHYNGADF